MALLQNETVGPVIFKQLYGVAKTRSDTNVSRYEKTKSLVIFLSGLIIFRRSVPSDGCMAIANQRLRN
ncbi:hypothetical protein LA66_17260 [Aureimonas altamirensis]|uniref:Uncharacterized protein n=1 Tax=Aureimonas altamirensis TaxID=370622 RepID=A0A0B1Q4D3_9HYPH|nr:hypothetical protein LA66_17260 [Aureimonas altamirensis]